MATKSTQPAASPPQSLLDLPVYSSVEPHSLACAPVSTDGNLSRTLTGIAENTQIQVALQEAQHEKTVTGNALIGHMHQAGADVYQETIDHHEALHQKGQGKYLQAYLDVYLTDDAKLTARHLYGTLEVGARSVAQVIAQSTMPDKPQQVKLTPRQRITGVYS